MDEELRSNQTIYNKTIEELSVKDLKSHIEFVSLKENLKNNNNKKERESQSRNKIKIFLGNDRNSINKLMKTAVSLLKKNGKLNKIVNNYHNCFSDKEFEINKKNNLLDTNKDNYEGLKIRLNTTSREKVKIEYKTKNKSTFSNNLIKSNQTNEERIKVFLQSISILKASKNKKLDNYNNKINNLGKIAIYSEQETDNLEQKKFEMNSKIGDFNKKIEKLKKKVKKIEEIIVNEEKSLSEKYLIDRISSEELKVKFNEMQKIVNLLFKLWLMTTKFILIKISCVKIKLVN